jgi:hypothetical protein
MTPRAEIRHMGFGGDHARSYDHSEGIT